MATNQEILDMLKIQYLAAITSPKPSYKIGEHSVDHNGYVKMLADQIRQFEELVNSEPCEEITYMTDEML